MDEEISQTGENTTVFTISNAEISKTAQRQCEKHHWRKLNENELACTQCPTALIVNPETLDSYLEK